ncbi:HNH endonuclease family protein [Citricoccus zhacaiensis]|nr:HNH endonuclease family protein [Citricoccus zhacaiensis]
MIGSEEPTPEPIIVGSETPGLPLTSSFGPSLVPVEESLAAGVAVEESRVEAGTVLAQLETIPVKGRAPRTGYDRDLFGSGWQDPDGNGCDARNDILGRDLTETIAKPGTHGCVITSGVLQDPFTAETIDFVRGQDTSTLVQIDHVVALSDAWQKGAQLMEPDQRAEFANDPLNLLAVDGPSNAAKGDGDAATWLPPNHGYRCDYVARQSAVKAKYDLWMTQAEHDAIRRIVSTQCPAQKVSTE